jgi:hypothetical protein
MWVIYRKKDHQVVGMSADSETDLERDYALEEVVKGLVNAEAPNKYDALQVTDRVRAAALITTPLDRLILRETPKGKLQIAIEEPKISFLQVSCDATDVHPVDGVPEIAADGESFATITVQKVDHQGEPQQANKETTCSTCAPTTALYSAMTVMKRSTPSNSRGATRFFDWYPKRRGAWRPSRSLTSIPILRTAVFASNLSDSPETIARL